MFLKRTKIRSYEMGLYFRDREFRACWRPARTGFLDLLGRSKRRRVAGDPWLMHEKLD